MGLTIHYTLSLKKGTTKGQLLDLLKGVRRLARRIGCVHVGKVLHSSDSDPTAPPFFDCHPSEERRMSGGPDTHGWVIEVAPGDGCETAVFGVLREYGEAVSTRRRPWPKLQTRWRLPYFCKTQYAGEFGWEHFRDCHLRVIRLLDYWREMGALAVVHDEGGYWKSRSEKRLRRELEEYDRFIAGFGGMWKDASPDGWSVESPIFHYANFERLEHEGRQLLERRITRKPEKLAQASK